MSASFSTDALAKLANEKREKYFGNVVTFSPKVFVPLTFACRDKCGYCTFVKEPEEEEDKEEKKRKNIFMTEEEVLSVAREGKKKWSDGMLIYVRRPTRSEISSGKERTGRKIGMRVYGGIRRQVREESARRNRFASARELRRVDG